MLIPAQPRAPLPLIALLAAVLTLLAALGVNAISKSTHNKENAALMAAAWKVHVASDHADVKHGREATSARNCLNKHGVWQVWHEPGGSYRRLCRTPEGEIFDQIVRWSERNKRWEEVTVFRPNPWGESNAWNIIR